MKILLVYILLLTLSAPMLFAKSINELKDDYDIYEVKKGESLKRVAQKNIDRVSGNYKSISEYMLDLKTWNTHIDNWGKIGGEQLYITYPYSPHTGIEWSPSLAKFKDIAKVPYFESEYHKSGRTLSEHMHMFAHVTCFSRKFS